MSSSWKYSENKVAAIKYVENVKRTKRMEEELEQFDYDSDDPYSRQEIFTGTTQHVLLSLDELKRLVELAKGSKSDRVDIHVETDKPIEASFYSRDHENRGSVVVAPAIIDDYELDRSKFDTEEETEVDQ